MSISDSNPEDKKNHSRPITGSFGFSNSVQHGIEISFVLVLLSPVVPFAGAQSGETPRDPYQYAKFSPSMAIIIGVLIAALFFMGLFSIYIRNCTQARTGGTVRPLTGTTGRSRRGMRGLDPAVIETFPTFVYSVVKGLKIGKGALECAVCLNEFEDDETLRLLPKCDHVFHPECIDAWLDSHTTCPVCRANLVPQPGDEIVAVQLPELLNNEPNGEDRRSELIDRENEEVSVHIVEDLDQDLQVPEVINPSRSINQNPPPRSKSVRSRLFGKFPRSHSTGHSLVQPGENCDRFTLRLPVEVRKQIVSGKLNRTTSCVVLPREGSSRRGYRTGGEGSNRGRSFRRLNRSDRWIFSMTRSFFSRAPSVRSPKVTADGEGTSSTTPRGFATTPFNFLGSRRDEPGLLSDEPGRPPV